MKKIYGIAIFIIVIIILCVITTGLYNGAYIRNTDDINKVVFSNGKTIDVEIARTSEEQSRGLMYREQLNESSGMLFIFNDPTIRYFWMKNTLIPLDIIFIDENKSIINIEDAIPCKNDPCSTYSSKRGAKYVLEVNQGYCLMNGIKEGDKIRF
jgi:uncharacterized protein